MSESNGKGAPFHFVDRPTTIVSGRNKQKYYPLDAIMATAETGGAVRITIEKLTAHTRYKNEKGASESVSYLKYLMKKRGFMVEWTFTPLKDAVDIWCVPIGAPAEEPSA